MIWIGASILALVRLTESHHHGVDGLRSREQNVSSVAESYDYIIVGGGQSGLVIANRLSEDTNKTVLIIEYGYFNNDATLLEHSAAIAYGKDLLFNVTTVPQVHLGNKSEAVTAASVVGGGSTINAMLFDRGAAEDYDNWAALGNPGWDFAGLLPYFRKSTSFIPPDEATAKDYNITWDASVYGDGPIDATYPAWVWPAVKQQFAAWNEVGLETKYECSDGENFGACWVPSAIDREFRRSSARNRYFDSASDRTNLHILTGTRVNEIVVNGTRAVGVGFQPRDATDESNIPMVSARIEVILAAGIHTPQILQRSGIGPRRLLEKADIPVLVDLPGVGANLQDHPAVQYHGQFEHDIVPNLSSLKDNETFKSWADELWTTNRTGPRSFGVGNGIATVPLPIISNTSAETVSAYLAQNITAFLPESYTPDLIAGYTRQRQILAASLSSRKSAIAEIPFSGTAGASLVLEKPLSRGTIYLNTTDPYAEPLIDYHALGNPLDLSMYVQIIRFARRFFAASSLRSLQHVETQPGPLVQSDKDLEEWVVKVMNATTMHSCGTAAMVPRELGGVVASDLTVYGVQGLSVGDASIMPLIPATHLCATVYAVAEKAADLIKERARREKGW